MDKPEPRRPIRPGTVNGVLFDRNLWSRYLRQELGGERVRVGIDGWRRDPYWTDGGIGAVMGDGWCLLVMCVRGDGSGTGPELFAEKDARKALGE